MTESRRRRPSISLASCLLLYVQSTSHNCHSLLIPSTLHSVSKRDGSRLRKAGSLVVTPFLKRRQPPFLSASSTSPPDRVYDHTAAILTVPKTSSDQIGNEFILTQSISRTSPRGTLSVILRCRDDDDDYTHPSLHALRSHVGDIYSIAWDLITGMRERENETVDENEGDLLNLIVYPQHLPNTPPEQWIYRQPTLECVISHDSILGWHSVGSSTTNVLKYKDSDGEGGLREHVNAINSDRDSRDLTTVDALNVRPWPLGAASHQPDVIFLEDPPAPPSSSSSSSDSDSEFLLAGTRIKSSLLFSHVAVGGTFDKMHYGHRKLLTLAVSSIQSSPDMQGRLLVGVTSNKMLKNKQFAEDIATEEDRIRNLKKFLGELAPGMKNRITVEVIEDVYGPVGRDGSFDALVLSDETLETGKVLNEERVRNGLDPLMLLCTRRTEVFGMSSTALRRKNRGRRKDREGGD